MRVALLFIDGVGIGARDPAVNPLARGEFLLSQFAGGKGVTLPAGGQLHPLDTTFGVPGRPQSATNQTALLTGEPAAALLGRHLLGFPNAPLRELLARRSIVKRIAAAGGSATFANCYPAGYLDALGLTRRPSLAADVVIPPKAVRWLKPSASTLAFAAGNVALRTLDDARSGAGLTNCISGERADERGFVVPRREPDEAAAVFWRLAEGLDFTLFEHYLADEAGHARDFDAAARALSTFDSFARAVVARRPADACVLICSDHGNVEDLSTRGHTLNPVMALSFGAGVALPPLATVADLGAAVMALTGLEAGARDQPRPAVAR
ncbi:MAG: metalloenzyme [Myxococcaceae bacterium]